MKYKLAIFSLIIVVSLFILYKFKSQMGIDILPSYSLSKFFPFKYIQDIKIVKSPKVGVLLQDSFDKFRFNHQWNNIWMIEKGRVIQEYDHHGRQNSSCILIRSKSENIWSYSQKEFIGIKRGDVFSYQVLVKIDGENLLARVGIDAFDDKMKAITWNYIFNEVKTVGSWIKIENEFEVSDTDTISYIRFFLSGKGIGEYRFDDVRFSKVRDGFMIK